MAESHSNASPSQAPSPDPGAGLWAALQSSRALADQAPPLTRISREQPAALSFSQQRLWFLQQAEPAGAVYNLFFGWRLQGPLNCGALEQAVRAVVQRHEIFNTTFPEQNGRPVQAVCVGRRFDPLIVDLLHLPASDRNTEAEKLINEQIRIPFNLACWPLIRAWIYRLDQEEHILLLVLHHIACDGASLTVLFRELQAFYSAFGGAKPAMMSPLELQCVDYAAWQRSWLTDSALEQQLAYWRDQLKGPLPILDFGISKPRPPAQTSRGGTLFFSFDPAIVEAIRVFRRSTQATVFNVLLAGFNALIHRDSGQEDVIVGIPIAGRNHPEIRNVIGFFVNTLALRTPVSGQMTFRQLLENVRKISLDAFANQDVPFEKLVEQLKPGRDSSHSPIFQTMFSFQSLPRRGLEFAGVKTEMLKLENGTAKFDLTLDLNELEGGICGFVEYRTDLFDANVISRMVRRLQILLSNALAAPDTPLERLPVLTTEERLKTLVEWNRTQPEQSCTKTVIELFDEQARRTPDSIALVGGSRQMTFAELNGQVENGAQRLLSMGVGPEVLVGVSILRSPEMVAALLSILKAGGAFVPLDPDYPPERIQFMIEDSGMRVVLTGRDGLAVKPPGSVCTCVVDESFFAPKAAPSSAPAPTGREAVSALADAAYVIYTSGSTGKPKGVVVENGPMMRHCLVCQNYYQLTHSDRILQFASLNFDTSIEQIFATLIGGAQIVLRDPEIWTPAEFAQKLHDLGLTVVNVPPAYWQQLASEWAAATTPLPPNNLRLVLVGGEEMRAQAVETWWRTPFGRVRLVNSYGPTEAVVTATDYEVPASVPGTPGPVRVPIGRPRPGRRLYVLNCCGHPAPIGVPGELHIGGDLLARGYLKRPELTAERFVPDPFSDTPGARMYKTGDLVRFNENGELEFLGRMDQQIKIRGFRIELGEIESLLCQCPGVRAAAVVAAGDADKRLVGFYVPAEAGLNPEDLRTFLKGKLPDYMVPSAFVSLDTLPLMPSGKIDRKALPIPGEISRTAAHIAPRTETEKILAGIFSEVLGCKQVGANDNFFDLGGHSLLAMQVVARMHAAGFATLTLADLFAAPALEALAKLVDAAPRAEAKPIPALSPLTRRPRVSSRK